VAERTCFSSVLEHFLGLYASLNSFTQLVADNSTEEGRFCENGHRGPASHPAIADTEIEARLRKTPFAFEFFQAMRLLERLLPDCLPVGGFGPPAAEVARLGVHPSLNFPASEIQSLQWEEGQAPFLRVNFMGLTGPQGPLPQWYTATVLEQLRSGDATLRDFLDIFNHRSLSLFYRAWQKYRFGVAYERGDRDNFFPEPLGAHRPWNTRNYPDSNLSSTRH